MATLIQRIETLVTNIKERMEREKKAKELKQLVDDLYIINEELSKVIWTSKFALGVSGDQELLSLFEKVRGEYESLRGVLYDLWGEKPEKIDILEPSEFSEPLKALRSAFGKLETQALSVLSDKLRDAKSRYTIAKSFSIIPDIKIDLEVFENARNFLDNAGHTVYEIAEFVKRDKKLLGERLRVWKSIETRIAVEEKKLDIRNLKGKKLSGKTLTFLNDFVENMGEASFESLSGDIVNELKSNFPELSRKLRVSILDQ